MSANAGIAKEIPSDIDQTFQHLIDAEFLQYSFKSSGGSDTLFHYTDINSFKLIIDSGVIWASDVFYLNDSMEMIYGKNKIKSYLEFLLRDPRNSQVFMKSIRELIENLSVECRTYVACFCSDGDSLSQWRGYGGEQGVSFGVSISNIKTLKMPGSYFAVRPVVYGEVEQNQIISNIVNEYTKLYAEFTRDGARPEDFVDLVNVAGGACDHVASAIKSSYFRDEKEFRVIIQTYETVDNPDFRVSSSMIVPYHKVELGEVEDGRLRPKLSSIIVGPGNRLSLTERSIKQFISAHHIKCPVFLSNVALRR
ncbi:MAG: DUF2971 domain-containing protein [Niveispirillum sp.]|nr:DUF2971 domain-containing protein [Niveispirillum sp.]